HHRHDHRVGGWNLDVRLYLYDITGEHARLPRQGNRSTSSTSPGSIHPGQQPCRPVSEQGLPELLLALNRQGARAEECFPASRPPASNPRASNQAVGATARRANAPTAVAAPSAPWSTSRVTASARRSRPLTRTWSASCRRPWAACPPRSCSTPPVRVPRRRRPA